LSVLASREAERSCGTWFPSASVRSTRTRTPPPDSRRCPDTQAFIDKLEKLRVVILCGRKTQVAEHYLRLPPGMRLLETFHTGAMSSNHKRSAIPDTFPLSSLDAAFSS
jgi:hypothetical protein